MDNFCCHCEPVRTLAWQSISTKGGGTFLFRQESTQRGGIGEGLSDALPRTNRPSPMHLSCALTVVSARFRCSIFSIDTASVSFRAGEPPVAQRSSLRQTHKTFGCHSVTIHFSVSFRAKAKPEPRNLRTHDYFYNYDPAKILRLRIFDAPLRMTPKENCQELVTVRR